MTNESKNVLSTVYFKSWISSLQWVSDWTYCFYSAVQNNSRLPFHSLPSFFSSFLSLSILPAFTSRISQYLALEYNQIYVVPIMPASDASYYIFQPAFSCLCLCMEHAPHKDNALSSIKFLLGTNSFHDEYLNEQWVNSSDAASTCILYCIYLNTNLIFTFSCWPLLQAFIKQLWSIGWMFSRI